MSAAFVPSFALFSGGHDSLVEQLSMLDIGPLCSSCVYAEEQVA